MIEKLSNHPYLDTTKPYDEMQTELMQIELYNKDRANDFEQTLKDKVANAQDAVVAFKDATNQFEHFRHTQQDFHQLRHATNLIWQQFCYPAISTWITGTLIPKLT